MEAVWVMLAEPKKDLPWALPEERENSASYPKWFSRKLSPARISWKTSRIP